MEVCDSVVSRKTNSWLRRCPCETEKTQMKVKLVRKHHLCTPCVTRRGSSALWSAAVDSMKVFSSNYGCDI